MAERFSDIARRLVEKAKRAALIRESAEVTPDFYTPSPPQPLDIIPGMTAAAEPCPLFNHWDAGRHYHRAIAQIKVDGIRALHIAGRIVSREALPLDVARHCLPALARLERRFGQPMVIDGEYQEERGLDATLAAHKRGEGSGIFWLFDAVPYAEWKANRFTTRLRDRLDQVGRLFDDQEPFLGFLEPFDVEHPATARAIAASLWQRGQEGIVVKDPASFYWRGRGSAWAKLKKRQVMEGKLVDHVERNGRTTAVLVRVEGVGTLKAGTMPNGMRQALHGSLHRWIGREIELGFTDSTAGGKPQGVYVRQYRDEKGDWSNA